MFKMSPTFEACSEPSHLTIPASEKLCQVEWATAGAGYVWAAPWVRQIPYWAYRDPTGTELGTLNSARSRPLRHITAVTVQPGGSKDLK